MSQAERATAESWIQDELSKLPAQISEHLARRFAAHERSTLFELMVGRTLQELGATLEGEVANGAGYRPDFRARFGALTITVEATCPDYGREMREEHSSVYALLPFIEAAVPEQWSVLLGELPELGPGDSKQGLKRALRETAPREGPTHEDDCREAAVQLDSGYLDLTYVPRLPGGSAIVAGPVLSGWDNSEERIRSTVRNKRRQVRAEPYPVLLAIDGATGGGRTDSCDRALFCRGCTVVSFPGRRTHSELQWDGVFMRPGRGRPPTYAGVLAFPDLRSAHRCDPVGYLHPRFGGVLPPELDGLEWRSAAPPHGIRVKRASRSGVLPFLPR
jgi:hypothetical protein